MARFLSPSEEATAEAPGWMRLQPQYAQAIATDGDEPESILQMHVDDNLRRYDA